MVAEVDLQQVLGGGERADPLVGAGVDDVGGVAGALAAGDVGEASIDAERDPVRARIAHPDQMRLPHRSGRHVVDVHEWVASVVHPHLALVGRPGDAVPGRAVCPHERNRRDHPSGGDAGDLKAGIAVHVIYNQRVRTVD